jgi:hypothetical protein
MPAGPVRQVRKSYPGSPATTPRGGNGQPPVKRAPECRWDTAHVRFFPHGAVRITGRREIHLRSLQPLPLHLANSIFLGDCLTSEGQPDTDELEVVSGRVVIPQYRRLPRPIRRMRLAAGLHIRYLPYFCHDGTYQVSVHGSS